MLRRVYGQAAELIGVLFFFIIVGVFGLELTIAGLAADSMCQPCVCFYTYVQTKQRNRSERAEIYQRVPISEAITLVYFRQETSYGTATVGLPRHDFSEPGRIPVRLAKSSGPIRRSFDASDLGPVYDGERTAV